MIKVKINTNTTKVSVLGRKKPLNIKSGNATISKSDNDIYNGDYTVTPKDESQELDTKNKLMADNVTVEKIPFYEVSNDLGNTIIIGGKNEYGNI